MKKCLLGALLLVGLVLVFPGCEPGEEQKPPTVVGEGVGIKPTEKEPLAKLELKFEELRMAVRANNVRKAKPAAVECHRLATALLSLLDEAKSKVPGDKQSLVEDCQKVATDLKDLFDEIVAELNRGVDPGGVEGLMQEVQDKLGEVYSFYRVLKLVLEGAS